MTQPIFITGTDTHVGKTYITTNLLQQLKQQGYSTIGLKPLSSGCSLDSAGKLRNEDALLLQQAASINLPYEIINPYAFAPPIAPHIAAATEGIDLTVAQLNEKVQPALDYSADFCLIEGVGGWHMPLNKRETMANFVKEHNFPVILVVGLRLGCLNHGILTAQAILNDHISLMGWIANCLDPHMEFVDENIEILQSWIKAPLLGKVEYGQAFESRNGCWARMLKQQ